MRALARLESLIQEIVERPAWLLSSRRLHPMELAQALTRAMDSDALPLADRVLAPDGYTLRLSADDYEQFAAVRRTLEREYADYLARLAAERGLTLQAPVAVSIVRGADLRPGTVAATTRFTEGEAGGGAGTIVAPARRPAAPARTEVLAPVDGPAALEVLADDGRVERRLALDGDAVTIGRRSSNELVLVDAEVSRRHARIESRPPDYLLSDLGSMNGTAVNGRRIAGPHRLADGDVIDLGHARLRFRRGG